MKIKLIVIDLALSMRQKRILAAIAAPVLLMAAGAIAYADVPNKWNEGEVLTAADLNENFDSLDTSQYALDLRVTALENAPKTPPLPPLPVLGVTPTSFQGNIGKLEDGPMNGYAVAAKECQSAFALFPSAHMCTPEEVVRHRANAGNMPAANAWYASGLRVDGVYPPHNNPWVAFSDCNSFSSADPSVAGALWNGSVMAVDWDYCDGNHPILCCE